TYDVQITINALGGTLAPTTVETQIDDASMNGFAATFSAAVSASLTNQIVATFADPNPNGNTASYTALIEWGDGTTSTGTVILNQDQTYSVRGDHTYTNAGTFTVKVYVAD